MLNHIGTVELKTDRLILRQFKSTNAKDMYKNWVVDPDICRFWQWTPHRSIEEAKTILTNWIKQYENSNYYHWVIPQSTVEMNMINLLTADSIR